MLLAAGSAGCDGHPIAPAAPGGPQDQPGSWVARTPFAWAHDGAPRPGQYVTVYSDAAPDALKERMVAMADQRFQEILTLFGVQGTAGFLFPPGSSGIDVYVNRHHSENINWAYWAGFIITIRPPDLSGLWYDYAVYTVRHELTHVLEFLIEGRESLGTDMWFREGLAVHVGCLEPTGWDRVRDLAELEAWIHENRDVPGEGNPIRIHESTDFPAGADWHQYYRIFELAVTYLLDERGLGGSYVDVLHLFQDARDGIAFPSAFQNRFGMTLADFEAQLFLRLRAYLTDR